LGPRRVGQRAGELCEELVVLGNTR